MAHCPASQVYKHTKHQMAPVHSEGGLFMRAVSSGSEIIMIIGYYLACADTLQIFYSIFTYILFQLSILSFPFTLPSSRLLLDILLHFFYLPRMGYCKHHLTMFAQCCLVIIKCIFSKVFKASHKNLLRAELGMLESDPASEFLPTL